jgi:hypothetical protein
VDNNVEHKKVRQGEKNDDDDNNNNNMCEETQEYEK